jgi:hypothetical protein
VGGQKEHTDWSGISPIINREGQSEAMSQKRY